MKDGSGGAQADVPDADVGSAPERTYAQDVADAGGDGRTSQQALLIAVPILPGTKVMESLVSLLDFMAHPPKPLDLELNPIIPFRKLRKVHFARLLILPESQGPPAPAGKAADTSAPLPAQLLFATDFDGTLADHLRELIDVAADGLDQVFAHCKGWSPLRSRDRQGRYLALAHFVGRYGVAANTFYTGTKKRSVSQIRREAELRHAIDEFLDQHIGTQGFPQTAAGISDRVRQWVFNEPRFAWLHRRPGPPPMAPPRFVTRYVDKIANLVLFGVLAAVAVLLGRFIPFGWAAAAVAAVAAAAYGYLRYLSATDPVIIRPDVQSRTTRLVQLEDHIVQNQITTINYIKKPLWFRRRVLKLVLAGINAAARFVETQGTLSGIPSIHFARWVIIDDGRRLLFFSNFDGSWESYLGDFVDKAHKGLTGIWSNCVGFPRTRGLRGEGAKDEQRFKAIARDSQVGTQVWYSAYRWLTVSNINDNSRLRVGLYPDTHDAAAWLRMGVSREEGERKPEQIPPEKIEVEDIQGLVIRSYRDLREASYIPFAFDDGTAARAWLGALIPHLTPASCSTQSVTEQGWALNVAFTRSGLERLGLTDSDVVGFSREFTEGMAGSEHRQRLLGDIGVAAPPQWQWGSLCTPRVDGLLFVFGIDSSRLHALLDAEQKRAARHGVTLHPRLSTEWLDRKEHFGFDDGIAQPNIAGLGREDARAAAESEIPPGEVILGYRNAYGRFPLSPTVNACGGRAPNLKPPAPDPAGLARSHDLGRNGSYVVFRQLEQDVKAFWEDVDKRAQGRPKERKLLAAKMVGRWPNGAPLADARFRDEEPAQIDRTKANQFLYRDDLHGDSCPVGAHIRRTNPRDGLRPDRHESLIVAARHRLMRRGRAYGPPLSGRFDPDEILSSQEPAAAERGLHFICFNTDIARQFEFVQSTWMNSPKFDGLYGDPDAVMAPHRPSRPNYPEEARCFTVQKTPVRERYRDLKQFVKMVGGCYLFMPGFAAMQYLADDPTAARE